MSPACEETTLVKSPVGKGQREMVIWRIKTDSKFRSIAYDDEFDARFLRHYRREELPIWPPIQIDYATDAYPDFDPTRAPVPSFPALSSSIACDNKVRTILGKLVHDHVDFLPLESHTITDEQYFILYPKTILGCLEIEEPEFSRLQRSRFEGIKRHDFKPHCSDCIGNIPIFKLPTSAFGSPIGRPYVNDAFKQLVEDNHLAGLEFRMVWDG